MPKRSSRVAARVVGSIGTSLLLAAPGSAAPGEGRPAGVPALYPSRAEAEDAARLHFNCSGAHRMGNQWMPCARHGDDQRSGPAH